MSRPVRGKEFVFYVALVDADDRPNLQANPTLAAGDVAISKDGGTDANLNTLPTVTPASGTAVKVTVSSTEMEAEQVTIKFIDQTATKEWDDLFIGINTEHDMEIEGSVDDGSAAAADFDGDSGLSATDDFYNGMWLHFVTGTLQGQSRKISDYVGSSKNFQFNGSTGAADAPFPSAPANSDRFILIGFAGT